jgi:hypothetical protein
MQKMWIKSKEMSEKEEYLQERFTDASRLRGGSRGSAAQKTPTFLQLRF